MQIKDEQHGDILLLRLNGRLDAATSEAIQTTTLDWIEKGSIRLVF
ncbi:MAG: hypothetical protein M2R45_00549 [Verrucomicrobia subdivision 3 bacterium]|nr:hypothetical protein [Limisphaerales bacterium]MCS1413573.1 hypothetical protein [Limisphaerales bacterium]